jgi:CheY-like chemotaxis protein
MQVLIVEDDLDFQRSLVDLLEKAGYGVEAVGDGLSALERIEDADVLLTDIGISGLDGLELCRVARALKPALGVIVMTGCDSLWSREEASRRGVELFLSKPFEREELLGCLCRLERIPGEAPAKRPAAAGSGGSR